MTTGGAWSQCGYPVTLHTNKDYCIGSSLYITSPNALEKIVWYKDGQPVDSAQAQQSLDPNAISVTLDGSGVGGDVASDASGNIYTIDFANQRIVCWTPGLGTKVSTVGHFPVSNSYYIRLFIDHELNIYGTAESVDEVLKYAAGDTTPVVIASISGDFHGFGAGVFVDCHEALYVADWFRNDVTKWLPGQDNGTVVARAGGANTPQFGGPIYVDSLGRILTMGAGLLGRWSPGDTAGTPIASWSGFDVWGMWMDGQDTAWVAYLPESPDSYLTIARIAPGGTAAAPAGTAPSHEVGQEPGITMDIRGNVFAMDGEHPVIYEWRRRSTIDSSFTPIDTGVYYAVVTNIQGYAAKTNKIVINTPQPGMPSISISATATSAAVCTPITFFAHVSNPGLDPSYQWVVSGVSAGGDSTTYTYNLFANGDQVYCVLSTQAGCSGPVADTSNLITLSIDPHGDASVTIAASRDSLCTGDSVGFTATVVNGSNAPVFEWLLNGDSTGDIGPTYGGDQFSNGDVITCLITSDDACGLAKSNSIPLAVSVPPTVGSGQVFTILHGHSGTLDPVTTGDIDQWLWAPAAGLSDPAIADPVASPDSNTVYTLTVTAPGGCSASGKILVNVFTPVSIPNAFTPNGDGHNDIFYVLGGPINSVVEDFLIFNRVGGEVYQAHHVQPGDRTHGWDGSIDGRPAPAGTYVYIVVMRLASGSTQVYKGTVILVR